MRPRYHIRWKLVLWGCGIVLFSTMLSSVVSSCLYRYIEPDSPQMGLLLQWISDALPAIFFVIFATLLMWLTSKSMVNRILVLSRAAKEIAHGNFDVHITQIDKHDEVYQLAEDFNLMAAELKHNDYLRKDFISNVSHEIKTPLMVINGYAELLCKGKLDPDVQRQYADVISRESRRMMNINTNMLAISRLDNQRILSRSERFSLDEQIRRSILLLMPKWEIKSLHLVPDLPKTYYVGNEELLEQVWLNLLDNAIKFSPSAGELRVTLRPSKDKIAVSVADQGVGMDDATQSRIFEQFFQSDVSRSAEGCGLGLSIVKRIVELHGGSITVESKQGKGSCFTVLLPVYTEIDE